MHKYFQYNYVLLYGIVLAALILLLKWLQWKFLVINNSVQMYLGLIALFFTVLGIWIAHQFTDIKVKSTTDNNDCVNNSGEFSCNNKAIDNLNLSNREVEVLILMADGLSNASIAEELHLSISTVKTHSSNLYSKMEVNSRTQAIAEARSLKIIQ